MAWGRIALLHAAEQAETHVNDMAEMLGYLPTEIKSPSNKANDIPPFSTSTNNNTIDKPDAASALFWQIQRITECKDPEKTDKNYLTDPQKIIDLKAPQAGSYVFDSPSPIVTSASLFPLILNALGDKRSANRIDSRKLLKQLSQGKSIKQLPKHQTKHWPQQLTIIIDEHKALFPYWNDFDWIAKQLVTLLGENCVEVISFMDTVTGKACHVRQLEKHRRIDGNSVLLLSDLQDHDSNKRYWDWLDLLTTLKSKGCKVLSLSPAQSAPQDTQIIKLAKPQSLAKGLSRQIQYRGFNGSVDLWSLLDSIEMALTFLSPLILIDTGLLRKLRLAFQWGNAALDGVIWNDVRMLQNYLGIRLAAEYRDDYQQAFYDLPKEQQEKFWSLVNQHHKKAYSGLKNLEAVSQATLSKEQLGVALDYYQSLLASIKQNAYPEQQSALKQQLRSLIAIAPSTAWREPGELRDLLHDVYSITYPDEIKAGIWQENMPNGFDVRKVQGEQEKTDNDAVKTYSLVQNSMQADAKIDVKKPAMTGQILQFTATTEQPATLQISRKGKQQILVNKAQLDPKKSQYCNITAGNKQWQLSTIQRPAFALNIGQNKQGLFIETRLGDKQSRVYWLPEYKNSEGLIYPAIWSPQAELDKTIKRDQYGLYQDINMLDIQQRFRWIAPGQFMMGSPVDEAERYDDEDLHQVTLTQGFWLADTTVTQTLWQAVTGKKPADFKGDNRPVERVSWDDVNDFIKQLKNKLSLHSLYLPYEAEWEYACRAGTQTPFSFGDNVNAKQVNYDGSRPYANSKKEKYRKKTVEVKSLPPNPWGLYEMHGNVWEWCQDYWQGNLGKQSVSDPKGDKKGANRVVRGGSWNGSGGGVRSAVRHHASPDRRVRNTGFRLALGHASKEAGHPVDRTVAKAEPQQSGLLGGLRKFGNKLKDSL